MDAALDMELWREFPAFWKHSDNIRASLVKVERVVSKDKPEE